MKIVLSLVLVFLFVSVANGQGPPREKRMTPKDFGDVERLERPDRSDRQCMEQERGPWAMPGQFRQHDPNKNKYGGPKDGMKGWGGDPFNHSPWSKDGGNRGPQRPFRGDSVPNGRQGWQHDNFGKDFKVPNGKREFGRYNKDGKTCPCCGK